MKRYELYNHLGNVQTVITDRKLINEENNGLITSYKADIVVVEDYYPFGMKIEERSWQKEEYRFGFNGKDFFAGFSRQDFGFRIYDPLKCRFESVDPLFAKYPELSTYQFASNTPIVAIDIEGLETSSQVGNLSGGNFVASTQDKALVSQLKQKYGAEPYGKGAYGSQYEEYWRNMPVQYKTVFANLEVKYKVPKEELFAVAYAEGFAIWADGQPATKNTPAIPPYANRTINSFDFAGMDFFHAEWSGIFDIDQPNIKSSPNQALIGFTENTDFTLGRTKLQDVANGSGKKIKVQSVDFLNPEKALDAFAAMYSDRRNQMIQRGTARGMNMTEDLKSFYGYLNYILPDEANKRINAKFIPSASNVQYLQFPHPYIPYSKINTKHPVFRELVVTKSYKRVITIRFIQGL